MKDELIQYNKDLVESNRDLSAIRDRLHEEKQLLKQALEQLLSAVNEYMPNVSIDNPKQVRLYTQYHLSKEVLNKII